MARLSFAPIILLVAAGAAGAVSAKDPPKVDPRRPDVFEALLRCRATQDDAARLACFDAAAANFESAAQKREVVVIDRKQVRETKRTLFGLDIPKLPFFGGGDGHEEDEVASIEDVVATAIQDGDGRWIVRLQEGGTWHQIDNSPMALRPRPGWKVRIKRGALGSYMMSINNQRGVRVRRTA
jgi:hypothetical protein